LVAHRSGADLASKARVGRFQYYLVVKSHVITASLCERDEVYFITSPSTGSALDTD